MAKKITRPKDIPNYLPIDEKMVRWGWETIENIRKNFKTQRIFPAGEVYPGWFRKNDMAPEGSWKSTGAGYDSLYFELLNASQGDLFKLEVLEAVFRYRQYLDFVDLGVGKNRDHTKVIRSEAAEVDKQYFAHWSPKTGDTHRPAIGPEIRYQTRRLQRYLGNRYVNEIEFQVVKTIEAIELGITL